MPRMKFVRKHVYNSRPCQVGEEVEVEDRFVKILQHLRVAELTSSKPAAKRGRPPKNSVEVVAPVVESSPRIVEEVMDETVAPADAPNQRDPHSYETRDMTDVADSYERKEFGEEEESA
jgi:hypothetical protein